MNKDKKVLNDNLITALEIIGGLLLLIWPSGSVSIIFRALGIVCMIGGGIRIYGYFNKETEGMDNKFRMIVSCAVCLLGLSFVISPTWLINSASFLLGLALLLYGLYLLYVAKDNQKENQTNDTRKIGNINIKPGMISPAIIALIGLLLIIFPKLIVTFGVRAIGAALLLTGASQLYTMITEKKTNK